MAGRRLTSEEQALWNAVTGTVKPIRTAASAAAVPRPRPLTSPPSEIAMPAVAARPNPVPASPRMPARTLDSSWERKIRGGTLSPDIAIDLHGHSLSSAHARLNQAIASALAQGMRVMLVVTGKPRRRGVGAASERGAIRAEIGHWLGSGPHADRIASVRVAHPRHGGDGALYIILRRSGPRDLPPV